ncbi:MAG: hypothetical protein AABY83_10900 [Pseudomonadota bacterium]
MKLSKISLAVGALCGAFAGQALALPLANYSTGTTTDMYISGASAQDGGLLAMMRRVCASGTLDVYAGAGSAANQALYFCQVNTAQVAGLVKPNIAVYKTSVGGSGMGVQPVSDAVPLPFFNVARMGAVCPATGAAVAAVAPIAPDTLGLPAYTKRTCTTSGLVNAYPTQPAASTGLYDVVPDAGFSDVEPTLFGATPAQIARMSPVSANAVIFGVPVTLGLRNALQAAQGLSVGGEDEVSMPSLTKTQIAALYSGYVTTWDQFASVLGVTLPAPVDLNVYLARRVATSGSEKATEVYFLNQNCAANVAPMQVGNDTTSCGATGVPGTVYEGSGGGNVAACLNTHHAAGRWAVGLLSTEVVANNASDGWRFIKVGGQAPTLLNVQDSRYDFWAEQSMQSRAVAYTNPTYGTVGGVLSGDKSTFWSALTLKIGEPAVVSAIDSGFAHSWGHAGLMALGLNYAANAPMDESTPAALVLAKAQVLSNPVTTTTRSPNGSPNNCNPPVLFSPTVVTKQ